jgi:hypothetical protein
MADLTLPVTKRSNPSRQHGPLTFIQMPTFHIQGYYVGERVAAIILLISELAGFDLWWPGLNWGELEFAGTHQAQVS